MKDISKKREAKLNVGIKLVSSPTALYLPPDLFEEISDSATELGLSKNALATIILIGFLERYEEEGTCIFGLMEVPKGENRSRMQVNLTEDVKGQLTDIALEQKRSLNSLANLAFNAFIQNFKVSGTKVFFDLLDIKYR